MFFICFLDSCKKDNACVDLDYGGQALSDSSRLLYVYKGGETLFFIDSEGHELVLHVKPDYGVYSTWASYEKVVNEGPCGGESNIKYSGQVKAVNIVSDTLNYIILYEHWVNWNIQGAKPIFFDVMRAELFKIEEYPSSLFVNIAVLLDTKGNEAFFDTIPKWYEYSEFIVLNNKPLNKVFYRILSDGSALYFNFELGLVAFREANNPLWVLDRIK